MKNVLVLGSSGQVGAYLCDFLRKLGYEVSEFDIADDSQQDLRIHPNELLAENVKKCDFVFFAIVCFVGITRIGLDTSHRSLLSIIKYARNGTSNKFKT